MEILMRNIPYTTDDVSLIQRLALILHTPQFEPYAMSPGLPINFKVYLFPDKKHRRNPHSGSGTLTLPNNQIGRVLLKLYGSTGIDVDGRRIRLQESKKPPRSDTLGEIQLMPYRNPLAIREKEERLADLSRQVELQRVQFAWLCRDQTLSVEWQWDHDNESLGVPTEWQLETEFLSLERPSPAYHLYFHEETREVMVERSYIFSATSIGMRYSRIQAVETDSTAKTIVLLLETPPSFEEETGKVPTAFQDTLFPERTKQKRRKLKYLNAKHELVAPFTWNVLRLECQSLTGLAEFKRMAELANLNLRDQHRPVLWRHIFSESKLRTLQTWLGRMDWSVAFQCEALHRDLLLDTGELLGLCPKIKELVRSHGPHHATQVLRQFGLYLRDLWGFEEEDNVDTCFTMAMTDVDRSGAEYQEPNTDSNLVQCLHVTFTPTGMNLRGPFPDTSNRILRQYPQNQDAFLRVSFTDEDGLKFRFDRREVDGPGFIQDRVGTILKKGFQLCGRYFNFLAYSQSALKQYTVWFVTPFRDTHGRLLNAESIRGTIGSAWPRELLRCPARYAARLSQAFTATEFSVVIESDQIQRIPDIERNGYCFSDGNAPCSQSMADGIHEALQRNSERTGRGKRTPSVFQVRILGAKGVLSVDPNMDDFVLCLRPSMEKFRSNTAPHIEIARSFNRPIKFFLNRPLVMILGGLGVKSEVFLQLQRDAVEETNEASKSLKGAAGLLERHGLGSAFALQSTFSSLRKLGIEFEAKVTPSGLLDQFMDRCMKFAVHHVLREIKFRARVPVPECWKLVGIVDEHNILKPNQIYACIVRTEGAHREYLKGPILISKSPTIHPGDVQIAEAIGAPPIGSPLHALSNCVVFSQRGDRPLPNKLSGSDLDGDEYDLITLHDLFPPCIVDPGSYPPAKRKTLEDRDSTIDDVSDFVVDYINNDMLGIVATNFLLIADRHPIGIFADECAKLAELHSWAVDFPKNGEPVPFDIIPQPKIRVKPDWFAPEITNVSNADYYESQTALGKMFRDIDLPPLNADSFDSRAQQQRRKTRRSRGLSLEDTLSNLSLTSDGLSDLISTKLRRRLRPLVDLEDTEELETSISDLFDHYAAELEYICYSYTMSRSAKSRLTEEEVFMGTIIAKSAQPRMRKDSISSMRDETGALVRRMWKELEGDDNVVIKDWANRAWTAWRISWMKKNMFGAKSFGWIALRAIFEVIKELDD